MMSTSRKKRGVAALVALVAASSLTAACIGYNRADGPSRAGAAIAATHPKPRALDIFRRMNDERRARGLEPLAWDPRLAKAAVGWSFVMAHEHDMHHSNIGRLLGVHKYNYVGENIAWGSAGVHASALHVNWMKSTGHRENILAPGFTNVGVGIACGSDGTIWATVNFGHLWDAGAFAAAPATPPPEQPIVRTDPDKLGC